jgi:carbonic anhydrase/acetyltransferase-like protein (isoleucine patch superfamily)
MNQRISTAGPAAGASVGSGAVVASGAWVAAGAWVGSGAWVAAGASVGSGVGPQAANNMPTIMKVRIVNLKRFISLSS